ncbi:MAG: membrane lipoprotein lipid attachment site-containing protein [Bacilli bacterium]|nr:membrane lipoprotein lipid attachment site-containing protein [Bacilli bacterium]
MKKIIYLIFSLLLLSGCSIKRVDDNSFENIINTILYQKTDIFNVSSDGYKFYLPRGNTILEKNEYNLKIKDKDNIYYLYISPVEYYYKTNVMHKENDNLFYSKNLNYNDYNGYVDISKVNDKYFIEAIYNYAKIETYVSNRNLNNAFLNICYMLSTINYNDSVINYKFSNHEFDSSTEEFSIFKSKKTDDNFLKYVEEFDKYSSSGSSTLKRDDDIIETVEGE